MWLLWLLDLCIVLSTAQASNISQPQQQHTPPLRFFIDEGYFLPGDTEILRAYIAASDNRLEISGESTGAFLSVKGYYVPDKWDVYWTMRHSCHKAYPHMKAGQLVNCIPGVEAISLKRRFVQTWQQAYGESAFHYIPGSYVIPEQYWLWRNAIIDMDSQPDSKWVLKANVHRGKGVQVVSQTEALSQALDHKPGSSSSSSNGVDYHNILIQKYCEPQMVIAGRSSYIRVWLLVTNITPLRAYLFKGGFAIFGKQKGKAAAAANVTAASSSSSTSDDLIVNLWIQDREKSPIWSLSQLEKYLHQHPEIVLPLPHPSSSSSGSSNSSEPSTINTTSTATSQQRRTFADAWKDMEAAASMVLAAALPTMRAAAANSSAPAQGMFEYFGLDFVFDAYLKPWLLEVNALPSLARRKGSGCTGDKATANCKLTASSSNAAAAAAVVQPDDFDQQKEQFVHDMLVLLGLPVDTPAAAAAGAGSSNNSSSDKEDSAGAKDALDQLQRAAASAATAVVRPVTSSARNSSSTGSSTSSSGVRQLLTSLLRRRSRRLQQQQRHTPSSTSSSSRLATETSDHAAATAAVTVRAELQLRQQQQTRVLLLEQRQQQQRRQHRFPKQHKQHHRPNAALRSAAAAAVPAAAAAASTDSHGIDEHPTILVQDLPAAVQDLLCGSGTLSHDRFTCTPCLTAADLAAVAAAEAELQRLGRFVPVYDLIHAHRSSRSASDPSGPDPENQAAAGSSDSSSSSSSSSDGPAAANGAAYLSSDRSVWQRLYNTWKGMSAEGVGLGDLGIMRYYTEESQLAAARKLELNRQDYVMSAWIRTRRQQQLMGGCLHGSVGGQGPSVDCVYRMLQQVVKECHIS